MADGKHPQNGRRRLQCQANAALTNALSVYMAKHGIESEGRAVETLVREGLANHGFLPVKS